MIEPEVLEQRIRKDIVNWEEQWLQRNKKRQEVGCLTCSITFIMSAKVFNGFRSSELLTKLLN